MHNLLDKMSDIQNIKISKIEKEKFPSKPLEVEKKEHISAPEQSFEKQENDFSEKLEEQIKNEIKEGELGIGGASGGLATGDSDKKREKVIEKILEKDLDELYLAMSPEKKEEFKVVGEETAREINNLLKKTKVKVKKIIDLIRKWLLIIPGVNKFFVEQEAKIKTDEIIGINFLKKL